MRLSVVRIASIFLALSAMAQGPSAQITGSVTDASDAIVAGATIVITNPATNGSRSLKTNSSGIYEASSLPPGNYSVKVSLSGFKSEARENLELQVDQVARIDFKLQVGNATETVEVQATAAALDTETATVGTVVENRRIEELPLNGRNYLQLASLVPGASTYGPQLSVAQTRTGGDRNNFALNVSGMRLEYNHYSLDGIENTDPNFGGYLFQPSVDALQEFKVETSSYSAEYGHGAAQINVITKSGTNQLHGSLFEFLRNSDLDAKNFFDSKAVSIPPFKRNQFGGTVGGPVVLPKVVNGRNRLFFFFDYEGLRQVKAQTSLSTLPFASDRSGNFAGSNTIIYDPTTRVLNPAGTAVVSVLPFPGNIIPPSRIATQSATLFQRLYPLPNNILNGYSSDYISNESQTASNNQQMARADWVQSSTSTFQFRAAHETEPQFTPGNVPKTGIANVTTTWQGMLGHTLVLGANKVNEFKFGIDWLGATNVQSDAFDPASDYVKQLGIPVTDVPLLFGSPTINISNFSGVGDNPNGPYVNYDTILQWSDNFSWNKGKHAFKFGAEAQRTRFNLSGADVSRGRFTFTGQYSANIGASPQPQQSVADFLQGYISNAEGQIGLVVSQMRNYALGFYAEDQWKVTPSLTINYGLRYELQPGYTDNKDRIVNLDFAWDNSKTPTFVRAGSGDPYADNPPFPFVPSIPYVRDGRFGNTTFRTDYKNFGPRLGIAWSPDSKTVIRAGAGIYFVHDISNAIFDIMRNQPFTIRVQIASNSLIPNETWANPYPNLTTSTLAPAWEWKDPTPYVPQWSLNVQRQLMHDMSLEVGYVGSEGIHLRRIVYYNEPAAGPPGNFQLRRPFTQLGFVQLVEGAAQSNYHSFQTRLQQRFSHGFTLLSAFSFEKSIDNGSGTRNVGSDSLTPSDNANLRGERGLSAFNFGTRWTTSFLYELPLGKGKALLGNADRLVDAILGGWQAGGIYTLQGGNPFSVSCSSNATYQNNDTVCRADATGISPVLDNPGPSLWFNKDAFANRIGFVANVGPYRVGNSGRDNVIGPGISEFDATLSKNFRLTERAKMEFRSEYFNLPNHPIFNNPGATVGSPSMGVISSTRLPSRQIQFALKLSF
jgi:hypothetical protein